MDKKQDSKYYQIRKSVFWTIIIVIFGILIFSMKLYEKNKIRFDESKRTELVGYGTINSELKNSSECYLCGNSALSLMGYYRKFDTVGIIALNEWYVLDLRLMEYDQNGKELLQNEHSSTVFGNSQGVSYQVNSIPSRGMSTATISADVEGIDEEIIRNNLCQKCLDKVTGTLEIYSEASDEKEYIPFCVVDFETLDLYPLQKQNKGYFVRDYWVDVEHKETEIEIKVFYLPGYN